MTEIQDVISVDPQKTGQEIGDAVFAFYRQISLVGEAARRLEKGREDQDLSVEVAELDAALKDHLPRHQKIAADLLNAVMEDLYMQTGEELGEFSSYLPHPYFVRGHLGFMIDDVGQWLKPLPKIETKGPGHSFHDDIIKCCRHINEVFDFRSFIYISRLMMRGMYRWTHIIAAPRLDLSMPITDDFRAEIIAREKRNIGNIRHVRDKHKLLMALHKRTPKNHILPGADYLRYAYGSMLLEHKAWKEELAEYERHAD